MTFFKKPYFRQQTLNGKIIPGIGDLKVKQFKNYDS